jgi:hypothetical protein
VTAQFLRLDQAAADLDDVVEGRLPSFRISVACVASAVMLASWPMVVFVAISSSSLFVVSCVRLLRPSAAMGRLGTVAGSRNRARQPLISAHRGA